MSRPDPVVPGPTDRRFDRRTFLRHMSALTAVATTGGLTAPAYGSTVESSAPPIRLPRLHDIQESDPSALTVAEATTLIHEGELSPLELVEACLARIERLEPAYEAFNTVLADRAREQAHALENRPSRGALFGIPLALKDNYHTAGVLTTANSHIFRDFVPEQDAEAWRRLKAQGAILTGKTQMGPLATTTATTPDGRRTTMNAWAPLDPEVSPGGSSSGSATAVAARMALVATGTQTGGSITYPALAQGLTGLKPTLGRVSLRGIIPLTYTRDHPGPLARDAMDAAIMLQVMAGPDTGDPRTIGLPPVADYVQAATPFRRAGTPSLRWPTRIGLLPGYLDEPAESEDRSPLQQELLRSEVQARRTLLATLRELGADVVEVTLPEDWNALVGDSFDSVRLPERAEAFLGILRRDVRLFGVSLSPWINGLLLPGAEYLRGQRAKLLLLRQVLDELFNQCDVVVQTSPIPFDIIGLPLIAFPTGFHSRAEGRLPVGAMLGGQPFAEDRLVSLVAAYQSVTSWHRQRPADPTPGQLTPGMGGVPASGDRGRLDVQDVMDQGA